MADVGIKYIPSNTFSFYDQVLDATVMLGVVPPGYGWIGGEIGFEVYFSMARGNAFVLAIEMTKWFDTNYHYIVPELGPEVKFTYASHKAVDEYKEAKAAFEHAYSELESSLSGLNILIETYFADIPHVAYETLTNLKGVTAFGFDLVRGTKTLDLINGGFPCGKYLFVGVVDGRNIWANDLADSLVTL